MTKDGSRISGKAARQIAEWKRRQEAQGVQAAPGAAAEPIAGTSEAENPPLPHAGQDNARPIGRQDYWGDYIAARQRWILGGWLRRGGIFFGIALIVLVVTQTDYGAHFPYVGNQPEYVLVCWTKSSAPAPEVKARVHELLDGRFNELWWRIWWGAFPVVQTRTPTPYRESLSWTVQIQAHATKIKQVCPNWSRIELIPIR